MRKLKGIIINGEYLGNKVAYNGLFRTICNISPIIMLEFVKLVSEYGTLYSPIEIKGFDLPEAYRIIIRFENKKYRGYADLSFVVWNYRLKLNEFDLFVDPISFGRKIEDPVVEAVSEEPEVLVEETAPVVEVEEPVIEEIIEEPAPVEPVIENVAEEEPEPEPEPEPVPEVKPEKVVIEVPEYVDDPLLEEILERADVIEEQDDDTSDVVLPEPVLEVEEQEIIETQETVEQEVVEELSAEPEEEAMPEVPVSEELPVEPEETVSVSEPVLDEPAAVNEQGEKVIEEDIEAVSEEISEPYAEPEKVEFTPPEPAVYEEPAPVFEPIFDEPAASVDEPAAFFEELPVKQEEPEIQESFFEEPVITEHIGQAGCEPKPAAEEEEEFIPEPVFEKQEPVADEIKENNEVIEEPEVAQKIEYTPENGNSLQDILDNIITQNITPEIVVKKVATPRKAAKPKEPEKKKKTLPMNQVQEYLNAVELIASVEKQAPQFRILQNGKRMDVKVVDENCFVVGETIYRWGDVLQLKD